MYRRPFILAMSSAIAFGRRLLGATTPANLIEPTFKVTLPEAHKGTLEIDTKLLDSYGRLPANVRQFYLAARAHFAANPTANFLDAPIVQAAQEFGMPLMGGPLLGDLQANGITVWLRPASEKTITVATEQHSVVIDKPTPGAAQRIRLSDLIPDKTYRYSVKVGEDIVTDGTFRTATASGQAGTFRLAFGSCCHKIGIHNPNLFRQIRSRNPQAMMLLGDIAVDDRNNEVHMHRADYQLRDVSKAWSDLASNVPLFASWDDHDYFDNDRSGIPKKFTADDRDAVRAVYQENWNNPTIQESQEGIYFSSRVGPVEIIMLDTRSCRDAEKRNRYGAYLGKQQMDWLKSTLKRSEAPFKIISSGTMWSDYVSNAKDSWGSWDRPAREELFTLIEEECIGGVLLVSGDRHGARGFRIPRPSGFNFYEFEPATLGGVSGPAGLVKNCPEQLFGYGGRDAQGNDFIACGEFTFETNRSVPTVTFRLIDQSGEILQEMELTLDQLTPSKPD